MENQGKRLLVAVVLALGIVLVWQWLFPTEQPKKQPPKDPTAAARRVDSPVGIPLNATEAPDAPPSAEDITRFEYPNFDVELSSHDAKVTSWQLHDPKYKGDWRKGEMIVPGLGAMQVNFYKSPIVIPKGTRWTKTPDADEAPNQATYTYETGELKITKVFTAIHPDDYLLGMTVTVQLKKNADGSQRTVDQRLAISVFGQQDPTAPREEARTMRVVRAACHLNGDVTQSDASRLEKNGPLERGGTVRWVGFNHPYFFFAVAPKQQDLGNLGCNWYPVAAVPGGMQVDLVYPEIQLNSDVDALTWQVASFIGPKHFHALERANDIEEFDTGFSSSVSMGWFSIIAKPLLWLLLWFHSFVGNWGIAIIMLTICVKLATLYWTTKSMRSMKAMAALKPKIDELQKKYGEDRAKIQQEMMGLYKAHGVNPLSGCLPMLLQMPIWLALYAMLSSAGELYLASFVPGWIDDLTATDPYYILPILLMGMMFLQSKLSPATVDNFQAKVMIYGLPLIFGVMGFFFPSGLSVYILTNTMLSLLHTLYMKKFDKGGKAVQQVQASLAKEEQVLRDRQKAAASKGKAKAIVDVEAEEQIDEPSDEDGGGDAGADAEADADAEPAADAPARPQPRKTQAQRRKRKRKH